MVHLNPGQPICLTFLDIEYLNMVHSVHWKDGFGALATPSALGCGRQPALGGDRVGHFTAGEAEVPAGLVPWLEREGDDSDRRSIWELFCGVWGQK